MVWISSSYYEYGDTYIKPCPVDEYLLFASGTSEDQLAQWNPSDWDYAWHLCPTENKSLCPFGIAWREGQCTYNEWTINQTINADCVKRVKLYKLDLLVQQGVCTKPTIWTKIDEETYVNTWAFENIQEIEEEGNNAQEKLNKELQKEREKIWKETEAQKMIQGVLELQENIKWDPIDLFNGAFTYHNTLLEYPTAGENFVFSLAYDSQAEYDGIVGYNRDHNWNKFIVQKGEDFVFYNGNLQGYLLEKEENSEWEKWTNPAYFVLTFEGETAVLKDLKNDLEMRFSSQGEDIIPWRMTQYLKRGVSYQLFYEEGYLTKIIDPEGEEIHFSYTSQNHGQTLSKIETSHHQSVQFSYYTNYEDDGLAEDIHEITIENRGETRKIAFAYDTYVQYVYDEEGNLIDIIVDHKKSHNLKALTDSNNQTYVKNTYANDRVISQKYGEGTFSFQYSNDVEKSTTITTRNGDQWQEIFDQEGNLRKLINLENNQTYTLFSSKNGDHKDLVLTYPDGATENFKYDAHGNLVEHQIWTVKEIRTYNEQGKLMFHQAKNGISQIFDYDVFWNLVTLTTKGTDGESERVDTFSRNQHQKLTEATLFNGEKIKITYHEKDLPTEIDHFWVNEVQKKFFVYDAQGKLQKMIDAEGNETSVTLSPWNLITTLTTPEGIKKEFSYDQTNNLTKIQTFLDETSETAETTFQYDLLGNVKEISHEQLEEIFAVTQNTYDKDENLIQEQDPLGTTWNYEYDAFHRIVKKRTVIDHETIVRKYTYDVKGNLISSTDPNGNQTTLQYTPEGEISKIINAEGSYATFLYDRFGNMIEKTTKDKDENLLQKTTMEYDPWNQVVKINEHSENGVITTVFKYDEKGNLLEKKNPDATKQQYSYDGFWRLQRQIDQVGNTTSYTYNHNNQITEISLKNSQNQNVQRVKFFYDKEGRLIKKTTSLNQEWNYQYNSLNQLVEMTDPEQHTTKYTYDYDGNLLSTIQFDGTQTIITKKNYDKKGNLTTIEDAKGNQTSYTFDKLWRLIQVEYPDQTKELYQYDKNGNIIRSEDANGTIVKNTYNALNQLTQRTIEKGVWVGGVSQENYQYDGMGRLISAKDDENHILTFSYDLLGNMISESQNGEVVNYSYNEMKSLTELQYPNGNRKTTEYDELQRVTKINFWNQNVAEYHYDSLNLLSLEYGNQTSQTFQYNDNLQLQSLSIQGAKEIFQQYGYHYDQLENILDNGQDLYQYDEVYQLINVKYNRGNLINMTNGTQNTTNLNHREQHFHYDPLGNRIEEMNNVAWIQLDDRFWAKANGNTNGNWNGNAKNNWNNNWNNQGNNGKGNNGNNWNNWKGNGKNNKNNNGNHYGRNKKSETTETLAEESETIGNGVQTITYSVNNRYTTNELNQYTNIQTSSFSLHYQYDQVGNLIEDEKWTYEYDYRNRLISATLKNPHPGHADPEKIIYSYDPLDRRTSKTVIQGQNESRTITYLYSNLDLIQEQWTYTHGEGKNFEKTYVYGANGLDDLLFHQLKRNSQTENYRYHKDERGSVVVISDEKGKVVESYRYDARGNEIFWGRKHSNNGNGNPSGNNGNNNTQNSKPRLENYRLYTAREYEAELDLYYYRGRYYDAKIGKFISRDPLLYVDGPNDYLYVRNNPINFVDPLGLEGKEIYPDKFQAKYPNTFLTVNTSHSIEYDSIGNSLDNFFTRDLLPLKDVYTAFSNEQTEHLCYGELCGIMNPRIWSIFNLWATIWSYFVWGESALWSKIGSKSVQNLQINFTKTVMKHLEDPARYVPVSILKNAILYGKKTMDPQWTQAFMYTIEMVKNNKQYILEVLYDEWSQTVLHFKYFK